MVSITVRNVPDDTRDELASRAAREGRSLQEFLRRELIDLARRPDKSALMAQISDRVKRTGTEYSAEEIVEAVHDGRR